MTSDPLLACGNPNQDDIIARRKDDNAHARGLSVVYTSKSAYRICGKETGTVITTKNTSIYTFKHIPHAACCNCVVQLPMAQIFVIVI